MTPETVGTIRSLGQGGVLGAGVASLLFLMNPNLFPGANIEQVSIAGALLGSGLHRLLSPAVDRLLFQPLVRFCDGYSRLVMVLPLLPFVSKEQRKDILRVSISELVTPRPVLKLPAPNRSREEEEI